MKRSDLVRGLKEELELESNITEETKFKELEEWDSMNAMVLIGYVSDNFELNLNANDIKSINTISELIEKIGIEKFD